MNQACSSVGRLVLLQKMRPHTAPTENVTSREAWMEESVARQLYDLDPQKSGGLRVFVGTVNLSMSLPTRPPALKMRFLTDGRQDAPDRVERIVVCKTPLIRLLSYKSAARVPRAGGRGRQSP